MKSTAIPPISQSSTATQRSTALAIEVTATAESDSCSESDGLVDESAVLLLAPPQAVTTSRQAQPEAASNIRSS